MWWIFFLENNSIGGVPRARIGQVSHGVVLGTVNAAEQNEDLVADIGRVYADWWHLPFDLILGYYSYLGE